MRKKIECNSPKVDRTLSIIYFMPLKSRPNQSVFSCGPEYFHTAYEGALSFAKTAAGCASRKWTPSAACRLRVPVYSRECLTPGHNFVEVPVTSAYFLRIQGSLAGHSRWSRCFTTAVFPAASIISGCVEGVRVPAAVMGVIMSFAANRAGFFERARRGESRLGAWK